MCEHADDDLDRHEPDDQAKRDRQLAGIGISRPAVRMPSVSPAALRIPAAVLVRHH
jgi:hypothetical protein